MNEPQALSDIAVTPGIRMRPMTPEDIGFLRELYVSTRWEEMQQVPGWTDDQRRAFLVSQADLQHRSYMEQGSGTEFGILQCGSVPIGRPYVRAMGQDELRVVDIALLPEWRSRGLGGALLHAVMARALEEKRFVSIHVERHNRARRLYDRLGFRLMEHRGTHDFLIWKAQPA